MNNNFTLLFLGIVLLVYILQLHTYENNSNNDEYIKTVIINDMLHKEKPQVKHDIIAERDIAVVNDPLYPPIARMSRPIADEYALYKQAGIFGLNTRDNMDTYQLVGYLINSTDKHDKWNLYGRQRYRGSSVADYYCVQQCHGNGPCVKINICKDMLLEGEFRDWYNLPNRVVFNNPVFLNTAYDVIQLKTSGLDYGPYF